MRLLRFKNYQVDWTNGTSFTYTIANVAKENGNSSFFVLIIYQYCPKKGKNDMKTGGERSRTQNNPNSMAGNRKVTVKVNGREPSMRPYGYMEKNANKEGLLSPDLAPKSYHLFSMPILQ